MLKLAVLFLVLTACDETRPKSHTVTFSVTVSRPCGLSVLALANGLGGGARSENNWNRTDTVHENASGSIEASLEANFDSSCSTGLSAQCSIAVDGVTKSQENASIRMDGRYGTIRNFRCSIYTSTER